MTFGTKEQLYFLLRAGLVMVILLFALLYAPHALSQEADGASPEKKSDKQAKTRPAMARKAKAPSTDGKLEVTVRPLKPGQQNWEQLKDITIEDIGESVIVLRSGEIVTLKDWVLGGLSKELSGPDLSDFALRQSMGDVAADLMLHEDHHNVGQPLAVGPAMPGIVETFTPNTLPDEVELLRELVCKIACFKGEGDADLFGTTPWARSLQANTYMGGTGDTHGFRGQFARASSIIYGDWKTRQFLMDTLKKNGQEVPPLPGQND